MTRHQMKSFLIGLGVVLLLFWVASSVFATQTPYKVICHHNPSQNVTLSFQNEQSYQGHLGTPHNDGVYDTDGACEEPTLTPTCTPTPGEPIPTVTGEPEATPTPTIVEEPTPEVTRVPEPTSPPNDVVTLRTDTTSTPTCPAQKPENVNDVWVEADAEGNGEMILRWGVNSQYSRVNIVYGLTPGDMRYSLLNTENDGREVIRGLDNGTHYWFSVANLDGCAVGDYAVWRDPMP